jgi:hypothetical protein
MKTGVRRESFRFDKSFQWSPARRSEKKNLFVLLSRALTIARKSGRVPLLTPLGVFCE